MKIASFVDSRLRSLGVALLIASASSASAEIVRITLAGVDYFTDAAVEMQWTFDTNQVPADGSGANWLSVALKVNGVPVAVAWDNSADEGYATASATTLDQLLLSKGVAGSTPFVSAVVTAEMFSSDGAGLAAIVAGASNTGVDGNFQFSSNGVDTDSLGFITAIIVERLPGNEDPPSPAPDELIQDLIATVTALNLDKGTTTSLKAKLNAALAALGATPNPDRKAASNTLSAFINHVEAQRGKKLTATQAAGLIADARAIIAMLSK